MVIEMVPKSGTHFCTSRSKMGVQKGIKTRKNYDTDFKQEAAEAR